MPAATIPTAPQPERDTPLRVVVSFELPSNGERWNWPLEGRDTVDAFCELLNRADVGWSIRERGR